MLDNESCFEPVMAAFDAFSLSFEHEHASAAKCDDVMSDHENDHDMTVSAVLLPSAINGQLKEQHHEQLFDFTLDMPVRRKTAPADLSVALDLDSLCHDNDVANVKGVERQFSERLPSLEHFLCMAGNDNADAENFYQKSSQDRKI